MVATLAKRCILETSNNRGPYEKITTTHLVQTTESNIWKSPTVHIVSGARAPAVGEKTPRTENHIGTRETGNLYDQQEPQWRNAIRTEMKSIQGCGMYIDEGIHHQPSLTERIVTKNVNALMRGYQVIDTTHVGVGR